MLTKSACKSTGVVSIGAPSSPSTDPCERVASRLSHYRKLRQISQRELAEKSGYSIDLISSIENGHLPGALAIWHIESALQVAHGALTSDTPVMLNL